MIIMGGRSPADNLLMILMKIKINIILAFFILLFSSQIGLGADRFEMRDSVLVVKSGVKTIPDYAFRDRQDIAEVRFESPSSLVSIGDYAFIGCDNLREMELPRSLRSLGEGAFRECKSLEKMTIPSGVTKISKYLFYWCEGLKEVNLPARLSVIERNAFGYCRSLASLSLPSGLKNIGSNAFSCCESLEEVVVPASVKELESYAFSDCRNLRRITFPKNNSLLGELILSGCDNMEVIYELSALPPKFDCNSFIFEPDETEKYSRVVLKVAPGKQGAYRAADGWKLFQNIED